MSYYRIQIHKEINDVCSLTFDSQRSLKAHIMMPSMRQCELADPYILQLRVKLFIEFKKVQFLVKLSLF